jgi:CRP-like cAMP-binding protein
MIVRYVDEKYIMDNVLNNDLNYDDILINEASKPIIVFDTKFKKIKRQKDRKKTYRDKARKIELIYISLLKFKGLIRYINYQGLCHEDIRKISYYIKHDYCKKGQYIFRQFDKPDAFYGVIKGKVVIREVTWTDLFKKFNIDTLTGANEDEYKCPENISINNFMSDCEEEYEVEEEDDEQKLKKENKIEKQNSNNEEKIQSTKFKRVSIFEAIENNLEQEKEEINKLKKKIDKPIFLEENKIKNEFEINKDISVQLLNKYIQMNKNKFKKEKKIKKKKKIKKVIKAISYYQTPNKPLEKETLNEFIKKFELEKFSLSDGMCFGEWGLIYDIRRTTSIYAVEDTDLFYLEKDPFHRILFQKFLKSDNDKVKFIINRFPIFKKEIKIRHILTKVVPLFFDKNTIVYTPYDKAENLYLLYQGECALCDLEKHSNKEDFLMNITKLKTLSQLTKGAMVGFESCEKKETNYNNCLFVTKEYTVILKLNVKYFESFYKDFKESLIPLIKEQKHFIKKLLNDKRYFKEKYDIKNIVSKKRKIELAIQDAIKGEKQMKFKNDFKSNNLELDVKNINKYLKKKQKPKIKIIKNENINNFFNKSNNNVYLSTISNDSKQILFTESFHNRTIKTSLNQSFFYNGVNTERNQRYDDKSKNSISTYYNSVVKNIKNRNNNKIKFDSDINETINISKKLKKLEYYDSGKFYLPLLTEIKNNKNKL